MILGVGNEATTHAMQYSAQEAFRLHDQFAWKYRGLVLYGTKVILPDRLYFINVKTGVVS